MYEKLNQKLRTKAVTAVLPKHQPLTDCIKCFHSLMSGLSILSLIFDINKLSTKQRFMQISPCHQNTVGFNIYALKRQQQCENSEIILPLVSERIRCQLSNGRQLQLSHSTKSVLHGVLMTLVAIGCGRDETQFSRLRERRRMCGKFLLLDRFCWCLIRKYHMRVYACLKTYICQCSEG